MERIKKVSHKGKEIVYVDYSNVILELNDFVIPARGISIGYIYLVEQESTCTQTTIYAKFNKNKGIVSKFVFYYHPGFHQRLASNTHPHFQHRKNVRIYIF